MGMELSISSAQGRVAEWPVLFDSFMMQACNKGLHLFVLNCGYPWF